MVPALLLFTLCSSPVEVSHRRVVTDDGAALALYRYRPPGGGLAHPPVLMVSDLGLDHALYDLFGSGLARHLASRGFTVYVAELRGQGASSAGASLRSMVHLDLPAIARVIHQERPGPIDLVAHGWVGTLALAASTHELEVHRAVAVNAPARFEAPGSVLTSLLLEGGHLGSLGDSPQGAALFDLLFLDGSPIEPHRLEELRARVRDLGHPMALEWLGWMRAGDLPLDDGTSVRSRLAHYDRPTLVLMGLADSIAGPEYCTALPGRLRSFSRFDSGDDLAHLTMLAGLHAPDLVFPEIARFLLEEDAP